MSLFRVTVLVLSITQCDVMKNRMKVVNTMDDLHMTLEPNNLK